MGRDGAFHGVLNEPARVAAGPVIQRLGEKEAPMLIIGTTVTIVLAITITVRVERRRRRSPAPRQPPVILTSGVLVLVLRRTRLAAGPALAPRRAEAGRVRRRAPRRRVR